MGGEICLLNFLLYLELRFQCWTQCVGKCPCHFVPIPPLVMVFRWVFMASPCLGEPRVVWGLLTIPVWSAIEAANSISLVFLDIISCSLPHCHCARLSTHILPCWQRHVLTGHPAQFSRSAPWDEDSWESDVLRKCSQWKPVECRRESGKGKEGKKAESHRGQLWFSLAEDGVGRGSWSVYTSTPSVKG